jgi:hypothetical protein
VLLDDVLPPSTIMTTAADGDDTSSHEQQQQQPAGRYLVNSVSNLTSSSRLSVGSGPGAGRASLDQADVNLSGPLPDATRQQQQQQQEGGSMHSSTAAAAAAAQQRTDCVHDNPLDVMLTIRANKIGDSAEAMRQQLLMMKLASGRNNFETQVSAFAASMQLLPDSTAALDAAGSSSAVAGMRVASVTLASPARRGSVAGQGRAAKLAAAQRAASVPLDTQLDAAADAAATAVGVMSAPGGTSGCTAAGAAAVSSSLAGPAGSIHSQKSDADAAAAGYGQQQNLRKSLSMASMRNNSSNPMHRSLIMRQPSLQRLLSGTSRSHLVSRTSDDQSAASDVRSLPGAAAAAAVGLDSIAGNSSGSGALTSTAVEQSNSGHLDMSQQQARAVTTANGDLPVIQQQLSPPLQLSNAAYASGLLGSVHGGVASDMITEDGEEDSEDGELTCEICFDAEAVVSLQACGHALCVGCCREMCKLHHFKPALCPYCRQIICGFTARLD